MRKGKSEERKERARKGKKSEERKEKRKGKNEGRNDIGVIGIW